MVHAVEYTRIFNPLFSALQGRIEQVTFLSLACWPSPCRFESALALFWFSAPEGFCASGVLVGLRDAGAEPLAVLSAALLAPEREAPATPGVVAGL